jgi:hypothetical protein
VWPDREGKYGEWRYCFVRIGNSSFEGVEQFRYLGTAITSHDNMRVQGKLRAD